MVTSNNELLTKLNLASNMTYMYNTGWGPGNFHLAEKIPEFFRKIKDYDVFLSEKTPGNISFKKSGKENVSTTTLSRFIRRHLKVGTDVLPDQVLEGFNNSFSLTFKTEEELIKEVKIFRGEDLLSYYKRTLISSCMTGKENSYRINFFAINPEKVGVIVVGEDSARSLIWTADDGKYYIDRQYSVGSLPKTILQKWANIHKYILIGYNMNDFLISDLRMTNTRLPSMDSIRFGLLSEDKQKVSACFSGKLITPNIVFNATATAGYDVYNQRNNYY